MYVKLNEFLLLLKLEDILFWNYLKATMEEVLVVMLLIKFFIL